MAIDLKKPLAFLEKFSRSLPREKTVFGLNMGFSSVKMVKLRLTNTAVELLGFAIEQNSGDMEETLKKLIAAHAMKSANISLSGQQAIIRYVDFPKMNSAELKQALKFEAQKHLPFPVQDVSLDGCILRNDLPDNKMRVLLAAVKRDLLDQRLKVLRQAGIDPAIVEIDSISLVNAFNFNYGQEETVKAKTVALLNVGSATSNLNILEAGMPALSRDISIGGNHLTQKIADSLNIDFKAAEKTKLDPGQSQDKKASAAAEAVIGKLAQEVRASCDYYESRSSSSVERVFVSGGASLFAGMDEALKGFLGLPVEAWDPLCNVSVAAGIQKNEVAPVAGQLAVAVGLALRG